MSQETQNAAKRSVTDEHFVFAVDSRADLAAGLERRVVLRTQRTSGEIARGAIREHLERG